MMFFIQKSGNAGSHTIAPRVKDSFYTLHKHNSQRTHGYFQFHYYQLWLISTMLWTFRVYNHDMVPASVLCSPLEWQLFRCKKNIVYRARVNESGHLGSTVDQEICFLSHRTPDSFLPVNCNNGTPLASFVGQRMNKFNILDFIVLQSTAVKSQQTPRLALFDCMYRMIAIQWMWKIMSISTSYKQEITSGLVNSKTI